MSRKVYQSSKGGKVFVPLEFSTRIIGSCTPRFSKQLSWKYSHLSGQQVVADLAENHGRNISKGLVQSNAKEVGNILIDNELGIDYCLPEFHDTVSHISIGRDGTTTAVLPNGYRESMAGTLSLYNADSERLHTIYVGCAPQHGKANFETVLGAEIDQLKTKYRGCTWSVVADGAKDNWPFFEPYSATAILDFYHLSQYINEASVCLFERQEKQDKWVKKQLQALKEKPEQGLRIIKKLKKELKKLTCSQKVEKLQKVITYMSNNQTRINYAQYLSKGYPIGSGVTEAACKNLIKARLGRSGMRWHLHSIDYVLATRALVLTPGRWKQAWHFIDKNGI